MEKVYFKAVLSQERKWIEKQCNIDLYSLNGSFPKENVLWKISVYPTGRWPYGEVHGFVEKFQVHKKLKFTWKEAKDAIKGNFLGVKNVKQHYEDGGQKFDLVRSEYIAFTLRAWLDDEKNLNLLKKYENQKEKERQDIKLGRFWLETGSMQTHIKVANVHGILRLESIEQTDLEKYAIVLSKSFPKQLVTWMTYCNNPEAYRRKRMSIEQNESFGPNYFE